jgi:hypothetical protein
MMKRELENAGTGGRMFNFHRIVKTNQPFVKKNC